MDRDVRLPGFGATRWSVHDYSSAGAYFVTICSHYRQLLFAQPEVREVIEWAWNEVPEHFPAASVDAFVVMPNHVHGIVWITDADPQSVARQHAGELRTEMPDQRRAPSLSVIVRSFKAAVTRELRVRGLYGRIRLWQPNYHDRVVRNAAELDRIREYIAYNPLAWLYDRENPMRVPDEKYEQEWDWLEGTRRTGDVTVPLQETT